MNDAALANQATKKRLWSKTRWMTALALMATQIAILAAPTPDHVVAATPQMRLAAGGAHSCALDGSGYAHCWGAWTGWTTPMPVGGLVFETIDAGLGHTCAVSEGQAYCWGNNASGQLGDGTRNNRSTPTLVSSGQVFRAITAGGWHTCALNGGGQAYCWGRNWFGQIGDNTWTDRLVPTLVSGGHTFVAIAAGGNHTCALTSGGQAYCWGDNYYGQLGNGQDRQMQRTPVPVSGGHSFVALAAGGNHTCGVTSGGQVYCWGQNNHGQLGDGSTVNRLVPTPVSNGVSFASVSASWVSSCALTSGGQAYCWGDNSDGQLGDGTTSSRPTPGPVTSARSFVEVAVGGGHVLARDASGCWFGWGQNSQGQVGDGTTENRLVPTQILCSGPGGGSGGGSPSTRFNKTQPANGTIVEPTASVLSWEAVDGVDHYRYCVDEVDGCTPDTNANDTSVQLDGLTGGATYYWQVWACMDAGCTAYVEAEGGHWSFTVYRGVGSSTNLVAMPLTVTSLTERSVLTLTLFTPDNQPWAGEHVHLQSNRDADWLEPSEGTTDAEGRFTTILRSASAGISEITAYHVISGQRFPIATALVEFLEPSLTADPIYVKADGLSTSTVELSLLTSQGIPIVGKEVEFRASRPEVAISPARGRTDSQGRLVASVFSAQPGRVVISAYDLASPSSPLVSTTVRFIGTRSVAAKLSATPDVISEGGSAVLQTRVIDVESSEVLWDYPVRFVTQQPTYTVSVIDPGMAYLHAQVSGTAVITAIDMINDVFLGRLEVKVRRGCSVRPEILRYIPSYKLGADVAYPHVPALPMPLDSNIEVDWKGCVPGYIESYLENGKQSIWNLNEVITANVKMHYAVRSFNLTEDLPLGKSKLKVVARTRDGLESQPLLIDVLAGEWPSWLVNLLGIANLSEVVIKDSASADGTNVRSIGSVSKMISIAKIFPSPKGWKMEPRAVELELPNTKYTDENGQKRAEAADLVKRHTTKLMLRGSANLWLACDIPPAYMFQTFASKKEIASVGPISLGGMLNMNATYKFDRNMLCYFMPPLNEEYFRQNQPSGSVAVDAYLEWREALPKVLATFFPPLRVWASTVCSFPEWLATCEQMFGEAYAKAGMTFKTGFKWSVLGTSLRDVNFHFLEASGEVGPKLMLGYELANDVIYINLEGNVAVVLKFAVSRPTPMNEFAPVKEIVLNAEAFATLNLLNLLHHEPKWTYSYKWTLPFLTAASVQNLATDVLNPTVLSSLMVGAPSVDLAEPRPILPSPEVPNFSGLSERGGFAYLQGASEAAALRGTGVVTHILASGSLTYTEVSVAHQPERGRTLLVWTQDDPARPVGGSREIYYSLWNGTAWSAPAAVTSDALPDVAPQLSWLTGDRALLVWNRARTALGDVGDLRKLEIAYSVYDASTNVWSPIQYLTNDDALDYSITLSRNPQGELLVAWASVESDGTAVEAAFFNQLGQLVRRGVALQGAKGVRRLSSAFSADKALLAYAHSMTSTGSITPVLRTSAVIWNRNSLSWSEPAPIPLLGLREERIESPAAVADEQGNLWLAYLRSGEEVLNGNTAEQTPASRSRKTFEIRNLVGNSPQVTSVVDISDLVVDDVRLLRGERGLLAVLRGGRFQRDLYAMVASEGGAKWSKPINLTNSPASELSFDAHTFGDELALTYVHKLYEVVTRTRDIEGDIITYTQRQPIGTELVSLSKPLWYKPDLVVVPDGIEVVAPQGAALPGSTALVSVTVLNQGDAESAPVTVRLYKGNPAQAGTLLAQRQLSSSLGAAFTETVRLEFVLPETDAFDLYVVLDPENVAVEIDEENNTAATRVFGPEYAIADPLISWQEGGTFDLIVPIFSTGTTATLPGLITVTLSSIEGTGAVAMTNTVPAIAPGGVHTAVVRLDVGMFPSGTYSLTTKVHLQSFEQPRERQNTVDLLPNLSIAEFSATDVTAPLIYVEGSVRNTSWLTLTNVMVGVFDASQRLETGLLVSRTIPAIAPMATIPISFLVEESAPCGLEVIVNPLGFPGTFREQRFSDNSMSMKGNETLCTRAGFVVNTRSGAAPLTVVFTNTSTPNTERWEWDFGDGTTSLERDPGAHVYTEPGVYTVTLRATSSFTSTVRQERMAIQVYTPTTADFESAKREVLVGEPVRFTNRSSGDRLEFDWDFGDGNSSSLPEPTHAYDRPGRYSVTLTARGLGGTEVMTRTEYITVYATRLFVPVVMR